MIKKKLIPGGEGQADSVEITVEPRRRPTPDTGAEPVGVTPPAPAEEERPENE